MDLTSHQEPRCWQVCSHTDARRSLASRIALHERIFTNAKNELSSEVTRTPRPVLGTLEAAPSWLAARLRLLALGLALLRPIGLHRACMWKAWRLSYMCKVRRLALRRPLSAPDRAAGCPELRPASANPPSWAALAGHLCRVSTYTHAHTYYICRCIYAFPCLCTCLCIPMRTHMHISTQCGSSLQVL